MARREHGFRPAPQVAAGPGTPERSAAGRKPLGDYELVVMALAGLLLVVSLVGILSPAAPSSEPVAKTGVPVVPAREARPTRDMAERSVRSRSRTVTAPRGADGWLGSIPASRLPAPGGEWTGDEVASCLAAAADRYGLDAEARERVVSLGVVVALRESGYDTQAGSGPYLGLFQFGRGWGSEAERLDGAWSCFRFVRAYHEGGEDSLRRHWVATLP